MFDFSNIFFLNLFTKWKARENSILRRGNNVLTTNSWSLMELLLESESIKSDLGEDDLESPVSKPVPEEIFTAAG